MQVNFNNNTNTNPAFKSVRLYSGAEDVLRRTLTKQQDLDEFKQVVINHDDDGCVDLIFHGNGKKSLTAKIAPRNISSEKNIKMANKCYSQRFYESTIGFIKRMSRKASNIETKLFNSPKETEIDEIIQMTKKQ